MNKPRTLIIVEGGRLEPGFFKQLKKVFGLNLDIYCMKYNIYLLYKKMKEMDFSVNIKDVLIKLQNTKENRELLSKNFAYTYLIFDFDPHHTEEYEKNKPLETIINNNIKKINEMAAFFIDETDPTIGKLYINYPMMESFKDCDSFDDESYLTRGVFLNEIRNYKKIVCSRKMANKRIDSFLKKDYLQLMCQNVNKLNKICINTDDFFDYESYLYNSNQLNILKNEIEFMKKNNQIAVLNTSVFFALDYYGNKNGFYDYVMKKKI